MAVNSVLQSRSLSLNMATGQDADGNVVKSNRTYNNVNTQALAAGMDSTAKALASLMNGSLSATYYSDKNSLVEVEDDD